MRTIRSLILLVATILPSFLTIAEAATFPDVPTTSLYAPAISALADKGIVTGNPDGTFAPSRTVNRAEFLIMLYRINEQSPQAPSQSCFKDVPEGSWFEAVVCDGAQKGYVSGYSDKTFKPEQAVNRVEALKMMFTVLRLSTQTTLAATTQVMAYSDVSTSAWYMQYLSASFNHHILPVPGQTQGTFGADMALTRGEAAAYIYNATFPTPLPPDGSWPLSSSMSSTDSSSSMQMSSAAMASSVSSSVSSSSVSSVALPGVTIRDFPFSDDGVFRQKATVSYQFSLKQTTVASVSVTTTNVQTQGDITCRLYKIDPTNSNFSLEFYIGYLGADSCSMRVALGAGTYQLDIAPTTPTIAYHVFTKATTGDGNDGFLQAKMIGTKPVVGSMDAADYGDFYSFTLAKDTQMSVQTSDSTPVKCLIYPMGDVHLQSFDEPVCGTSFLFPAGTYYVGVMQRDGLWAKASYSIWLGQ